jgi:hypothetical protein
MKESYVEGLATHGDPESCAVGRKGGSEALTGARAGRVLSRVIPVVLRGADAVGNGGRPHLQGRQGETLQDPARSETPSTFGITSQGNREIPRLSGSRVSPDRIGKPKGVRR